MAEDALDALLKKFEQDAAAFEREYGSWLGGGTASAPPAKNQPDPAPVPAKTATASKPPVRRTPAPAPPAVDRRDLQLYGLRRRYGRVPADPALESAAAPEPPAGKAAPLASLDSGALYLRARAALAAGLSQEEAGTAVRLLHKKNGEDLFRRTLLYVYTMLQQPSSLQGLEQTAADLPARAGKAAVCGTALCCLREAALYIADVTRKMQALQEQGLRDRQKMLEQALQQAQDRYDQARRDLTRPV